MKKTRGRFSRVTVPLNKDPVYCDRIQAQLRIRIRQTNLSLFNYQCAYFIFHIEDKKNKHYDWKGGASALMSAPIAQNHFL